LHYFNNEHIINSVKRICKSGTEGDAQIAVYDESGFEGLKKYLMDNIEFKLN